MRMLADTRWWYRIRLRHANADTHSRPQFAAWVALHAALNSLAQSTYRYDGHTSSAYRFFVIRNRLKLARPGERVSQWLVLCRVK